MVKTTVSVLCAVLVLAEVAYVFYFLPDESTAIGEESSVATSQLQAFPAESSDDSIGDDRKREKLPILEETPPGVIRDESLSDEQVIQSGQQSAVRITGSGNEFLGSGVVVAVGEKSYDVLTAAHVVDGLANCWVAPTQSRLFGKPSFAVILRADLTSDLAYLRVNALADSIRPVTLSLAAIDKGTLSAGWIVNSTGTGDSIVTRVDTLQKQVAMRSQNNTAISYWYLDSPSIPGMSGSALLNSQGELVGIASGNSEGQAFYCSEKEIQKFADAAKIDSIP